MAVYEETKKAFVDEILDAANKFRELLEKRQFFTDYREVYHKHKINKLEDNCCSMAAVITLGRPTPYLDFLARRESGLTKRKDVEVMG